MKINPVRRISLLLALWAARNPWSAIGLVALMTIACCSGFSKLRVDASNNAMFGKHDQAQVDYQKFQKEFGREDAVVIGIKSDKIFSGEFMTRLRSLHHDLERSVPWTAEVTSLANAPYVDEHDGVVRTRRLGDRWTERELPASIQRDVLESPLYKGALLSADGKMTLIVVRPQTFVTEAALEVARSGRKADGSFFKRLGKSIREWHDGLDEKLGIKPAARRATGVTAPTAATAPHHGLDDDAGFQFDGKVSAASSSLVRLPGPQTTQFITAIREAMQRHRDDGFELLFSGGPVIEEEHESTIHRDAGVMTVLAAAVAIIALALQLRSVVGVVLPLAVILVSLLATLGMMGWVDFPITVVSQALPPIMLTMGVLSSVHLIAHFLQDREPDFDTAVRNMFEHSGDPVVYTVLTDVLGFLAFTTARLEPINEFGWMAAFGSLVGLLFTILLLPALLRLIPVKRGQPARLKYFDVLTAFVVPVGQFCGRHYRVVLIGTVVLISLATPGVARLEYAHDVLSWLEASNPVRTDTLEIDRHMKAMVPLEIVIDTGVDEGILTSDFMENLRTLGIYCNSLSDGTLHVGSTTSIADSIARVHRVLTHGAEGHLPKTSRLLHQELVLYEGGGAKELQRLTDRRYSKARVTMRLAWADAHAYVGLDEKVRKRAAELFGTKAAVTVTGVAYMQAIGALDVIDSMWESYLLAAGLIAVMLVLVLRRIKVSIASLIPNFLPVWIALGLMGYLALPVDMFMVLLGDIALAVSVDDTVHFMHTALRHKRRLSVGISEAIKDTLTEVGAPLVIASVVMACGFYTFALSSIAPLSRFGIVLGCTLLLALILDLVVSPALITMIAKGESMQAESNKLAGVVQ
ncbi:hypothetical protein EGT07_13520 [Herbaspirillum sp. HC18]|nr:hypothetical protein EGT07_13520 [Herbaspirillum sp. HC18]